METGRQWGIKFSFAEQPRPDGIAQAFIIGGDFIANDSVCLILGDNIFYGQGFQPILLQAVKLERGALVFGYWVSDPEGYGLLKFDKFLKVLSIEEKPKQPKSNYVVVGLYFYDNHIVEIASSLKPSARGELEITDLNREYLMRGDLRVKLFGRGFAWMDTGTHTSLLEAATYVETIEKRQGLKVACVEEVAYRMGYIDSSQVEKLARLLINNGYGQHLLNMLSYEVHGSLTPDTSRSR